MFLLTELESEVRKTSAEVSNRKGEKEGGSGDDREEMCLSVWDHLSSLVSQRIPTALPDLFSNLSIQSFFAVGFSIALQPTGLDKSVVINHVQFPSLLKEREGQAKAPNAHEPLSKK